MQFHAGARRASSSGRFTRERRIQRHFLTCRAEGVKALAGAGGLAVGVVVLRVPDAVVALARHEARVAGDDPDPVAPALSFTVGVRATRYQPVGLLLVKESCPVLAISLPDLPLASS
jgi:hypothetical protein